MHNSGASQSSAQKMHLLSRYTLNDYQYVKSYLQFTITYKFFVNLIKFCFHNNNMKKLITFITLALSLSFVNAKVYPGLKVKDHKNLSLVIEGGIRTNTGITYEEIKSTIQLLLPTFGIKEDKRPGQDHLHIQLAIADVSTSKDRKSDIIHIKLTYRKRTYRHFGRVEDQLNLGAIFVPEQGNYYDFGVVSSKSEILNGLGVVLKRFMDDYIESNIE